MSDEKRSTHGSSPAILRSDELNAIVSSAGSRASGLHHTHLTPEHLVASLLDDSAVARGLQVSGVDVARVRERALDWLARKVPTQVSAAPAIETRGYAEVLERASELAMQRGCATVRVGHLVLALAQQKFTHAAEWLGTSGSGFDPAKFRAAMPLHLGP